MSNKKTKELILLIHSLSTSEKRFFKVQNVEEEKAIPLFVRLFDHLDQKKASSDTSILQQMPFLTKSKLANLKRHLYQQILKSLRLQHRLSQMDITISEYVDHARLLYGKGLYHQSLKILDRALHIASRSEDLVLQLEIMEFEKRIEARHITRSRTIENKVEKLIERSQLMATHLRNSVLLSNFALQIHGFYIKKGLVRSKEDISAIRVYFKDHLPKIEKQRLDPVEQGYLYQSHMWKHYIEVNLPMVYLYAKKWMNAYLETPQLLQRDPDPFLRALHYATTACFYLKDFNRFNKNLRTFTTFMTNHRELITITTQKVFFIYYNNAILNKYLLTGEYTKALALRPRIEQGMAEFASSLDIHRVILFHYKLAWIAYGCGKYDLAIDHLNNILQSKSAFLRRDVECYVKLLHLCAHMELKNRQLSQSLLNSVDKSFKRTRFYGTLVAHALQLIRTILYHPDNAAERREQLLAQCQLQASNVFEMHQAVYFDFYAWAKTFNNRQTIEKTVREEYIAAR